jgi:hypothetical protein
MCTCFARCLLQDRACGLHAEFCAIFCTPVADAFRWRQFWKVSALVHVISKGTSRVLLRICAYLDRVGVRVECPSAAAVLAEFHAALRALTQESLAPSRRSPV